MSIALLLLGMHLTTFHCILLFAMSSMENVSTSIAFDTVRFGTLRSKEGLYSNFELSL